MSDFMTFCKKKHFSFPSLPAAVLRCLYGWHSRQTIDISFYIYFLALAYLDLYFMFLVCPKNDLFRDTATIKIFTSFLKIFVWKVGKGFPLCKKDLMSVPLSLRALFQLFFKLENHMQKGIVSQCSSRTAPKFSSADCFWTLKAAFSS